MLREEVKRRAPAPLLHVVIDTTPLLALVVFLFSILLLHIITEYYLGTCRYGDHCLNNHDVVPFTYCGKYNSRGFCDLLHCTRKHELYEYVPSAPEVVASVERKRAALIQRREQLSANVVPPTGTYIQSHNYSSSHMTIHSIHGAVHGRSNSLYCRC